VKKKRTTRKKVEPSPNGDEGRDDRGRFAKGNGGGPGNPLGPQVEKLRAALIAAITTDDIVDIARALIKGAKNGNVQAAREVFDRSIGKPMQAVELTADGATLKGEITHRIAFDHGTFEREFEQFVGQTRGVPDRANGNGQSVHPDHSDN
jgi:hypothetical protein